MGNLERVGAVIPAAGKSQRMGGVDKIFAPLGGKPLLSYTLEIFQRCSLIQEIVVVLNEVILKQGQKLVQGYPKVIALCPGGERRRDSVEEGLKRLKDCQWVVIHDGARPCLTPDLIERGLEAARETGAAIAALPVKETIKLVEGGIIKETPPRERLWVAQTPQVFRFDLIMEACRHGKGEATDDAALVEALGYKVKVYIGSYDNIKVTTPEDLILAEAILRRRDAGWHRL